MPFIQRVLSFGVVPIVALLALQVLSPDTFRSLQHAVQPYIADTPLSHFFPGALPPRAETPIFMTAVSHWSHVEKIATIAIELATLGYPITFITGRVFDHHISSLHPNIKFEPMLGLDDKLSEEDVKTWQSLPPGPEQELFVEKKVLVDSIPDLHETLQIQARKFREENGDSKPLIMLFDQVCLGHHPVLLGAPGIRPDVSIGISIAPLAFDSNDTYPFRTGKPPHTGPDAKDVHWKATQEHLEEWRTKAMNEYLWAKLRDMGAVQDSYPSVLPSLNSVPDMLMTLGIPQFEFPRSDITQDVRYYGGFKKVGKNVDGEKLPDWWDDIAKAKKVGKKIIAVSQGTIETNPEDLILPTLRVLKDRDDVLIIASFVVAEPEDVPDLVVPENTRVTKFVPYDQLLPLADILISNGGYGGVQQALRNGVPMVVSGEGQDKADVNAIVEWSGVGLNIGGRLPGAEKIGEAVKKILGDDSYAKKAKTLSKEFEKYDVGEVFDQVIQEVVRNHTRRSTKQDDQ